MASISLFLALLMTAPVEAGVPSEAPVEQSFDGVDWDREFGVESKTRDPVTGELAVAPYAQSNANAGAAPFVGDKMASAFGGQPGIRKIAERFVGLNKVDPRIKEIFAAEDAVRLRRTVFEQFCYILNAGCDYTGRNMKDTHKGMGIQRGNLNAIVENLQQAMREAEVPFAAQNRFLAKLAPMSRDVVER